MTRVLIELAGWLGAALLLLAYAMVSFRKLRPDSVAYQLMNFIGSCLLVVNTVYLHAYPSAMVNIVWIFIAIVAYIRAVARGDGRAGTESR
ncbi:MAG: hypothetical protein LAP21_10230 [Acidobacteriia bacterium]|nr:hypothetical protein [Terriglobia bacterium]